MGKAGVIDEILRVWHGSPHNFDKFDLRHMGKGEGAQAYGKGAYTTSSRDVAQIYKEMLGRDDQAKLYEVMLRNNPEMMLDWQKPLSSQRGLIDLLGDDAARIVEKADMNDPQGVLNLSGRDPLSLTGRDIYYGVGEKYNKPLTDQIIPVDARLKQLKQDNPYVRFGDITWEGHKDHGKNGYNEFLQQQNPELLTEYLDLLGKKFDLYGQKRQALNKTSDDLYNRGIGGITYMGERKKAGEDVRNYVNFNANDMQILNKYLHPATAGGAGIIGSILGINDEDMY